MRTTRRLARLGALGAGFAAAVIVAPRDSAIGRTARRVARRLARDVRYLAGSAPGIVYRLSGRRPDPYAPDDVIADRIRSALGPLEKRLDVPRVLVMVDRNVAILHGDVATPADARAIENAVMRVSGVDGVESHLHVGLAVGDTRPSEGRAAPQPPSPALDELLHAASSAGAQDSRYAVRAVLGAFFDRVPGDERVQVFAHLPADVRALAAAPRHYGERPPRLRSIPQLVAAATAEGGIEADRAEAITRAVVTTLRRLVADEAHDVAAVLPAELRELWEAAPAH